MSARVLRLVLRTSPCAALLIGCAGTEASPPSATGASVAGLGAPTTAATEATVSTTRYGAVLAGPQRTEKERARDGARHPLETLSFFGVREDATVVELWPGGGYYTSILAPILAEHGKLVVTHFDPQGDPKSEDTQDAVFLFGRLGKDPNVFGRVVRQQIATKSLSFGPDASADFVLTFRNVHNWIDEGYADAVFAAAARVLKPGGVLGVEEHRAAPPPQGSPAPTLDAALADIKKHDTGYVPEAVVIGLAERAGLRLAGRSEVNANAKDTKDYPKGVWSLPPTLAEKETHRDTYLAIGESDRMTLKFVKP